MSPQSDGAVDEASPRRAGWHTQARAERATGSKYGRDVAAFSMGSMSPAPSTDHPQSGAERLATGMHRPTALNDAESDALPDTGFGCAEHEKGAALDREPHPDSMSSAVVLSSAMPLLPPQAGALAPDAMPQRGVQTPNDAHERSCDALDRVVRCASFVQRMDGSARFTLRLDGDALGGAAIRIEADQDGSVCVRFASGAVRGGVDRELIEALARRLRGAGVRLIEVEADA